MAGVTFDELDALFAQEIGDPVGPDGEAQAADGDDTEEQPADSAPAATAEEDFERRYQERFNKDVAALRSSYDKRLHVLEDQVADLSVDIELREEFIGALSERYKQYDGDDADRLAKLRERRAEERKSLAADKRKLARLEAERSATDLAARRQGWLDENVKSGAFPEVVLSHPGVQRAIADGRDDRDVMAEINRVLAAELASRKPGASQAAAPKVEQTRQREQARGTQPLGSAPGGAAPSQKPRTFAEAEAAFGRGLSKIKGL